MKNIKYAFAALFLLFTAVSAQTKWDVDKAHSKVGFSVTHMVISEVDGFFNDFQGDITTTGDDFSTAKINFTIDVNSITTDNQQRDTHLKSDDFFNAAKFPKITFVGKSLKKVGDNKYKLTGDFTIRDVTKEITLDVTMNGIVKDPWGLTRAGFKIRGEINRFDYNLKWNKMLEAGGLVVSKDVELVINLELTHK
jgi:polyisoprenoid-binding protein YceI